MRAYFKNSLVFLFTATLLFAFSFTALAEGETVTPEEAQALIKENKDIIVLDVRNPNERVVAHYEGSINIPVKELEERYGELPAGKPILIHCAKGVRAERAYNLLQEKRPDLTNVKYIKGAPIFE